MSCLLRYDTLKNVQGRIRTPKLACVKMYGNGAMFKDLNLYEENVEFPNIQYRPSINERQIMMHINDKRTIKF